MAPLVLRKALSDVRVGQYTVPAGTAILIHVFAMHNTSANYERHTEFLPVRGTAMSSCPGQQTHDGDCFIAHAMMGSHSLP